MKMCAFVVGVLLGHAAVAPAQTVIIDPTHLNGSFETFGTGANLGTAITTSANTTVVPNWTVMTSSGSASVRVLSNQTPLPVDGSYWLGLNSQDTTAGVVFLEQSFATTIGMSYLVSFSAGRDGLASGLVGVTGEVFDAVSGGSL